MSPRPGPASDVPFLQLLDGDNSLPDEEMLDQESVPTLHSNPGPNADVPPFPYRDLDGAELSQLSEPAYLANDLWKKNQKRRRFCFVISLSVLYAFIFLIVIAIARTRTPEDVGFGAPFEDEELAKDIRLEKYQTPSDAQFCADWSESQSDLSTASFELPASTNLTFFLTRGSRLSGNFTVQSERTSGSNIKVDVVAQYEDSDRGREQLKKAQACFAGQPNEQGILLWADPEATALHEGIRFSINVQLPDITVFNDVSTDFTNSNFAHSIEILFSMWRPTNFAVVRLNARDAPITAQSIISDATFVHTTNANVTGDFWSWDTVRLQTSNAPIFGVVWALGPWTGAECTVAMRTNNAPVTAFFSMSSDYDDTKLNASIHTTSGSLSITMPRVMMSESPVFVLEGSTTNAPASLYLAPEYEGPFYLSTTAGGKAEVGWDPEVRDPWGKGRKKVLEMNEENSGVYKEGRMYWGEPPQEGHAGSIKLETTEEDVVIHTGTNTLM